VALRIVQARVHAGAGCIAHKTYPLRTILEAITDYISATPRRHGARLKSKRRPARLAVNDCQLA